MTIRQLRASATGPSLVRSLEVGFAHAEYSLPDFIFHGLSQALKNVEARDVAAILDPAQARPQPTPRLTKRQRCRISFRSGWRRGTSI